MRAPTPAGPITELFDQLHALHLRAGEPGVRQIAHGVGPGVISYTTVHNVFRGPRVPKWGNLELIVEQLGGNVELFRALWRAARSAELSDSADAENNRTPIQPHQPASFVMVTYRPPASRDENAKPDTNPWGVRGAGVTGILEDLAVARRATWVCWFARREGSAPDDDHQPFPIHQVELSEQEVEQHYEGYCNSTIWPLYHNMIERPEFRREWQAVNRVVNQRFADAIAQVAAHRATVWIHDYQLQLVPTLLRQQRPDLRIGFFMHISFPEPWIFRQLPGRAEVLRGLLGSDLVGFQVHTAATGFLSLVRQVLDLPVDANTVHVDNRRVVVDSFPISVDVGLIEQVANLPQVRRRAAELRSELGNPRLLLVGSERLDYTKGITQRLLAFEELLAEGRLSPESVAMVQVGARTREGVAEYAALRERVERLAGHINAAYGGVGRPVVHYTNKVFRRAELIALYLTADVMLVTPLSDGMNLVAKEYVASRVDNQGVLVLSEFAGAAAELRDAILVNPNDMDDLKGAILRATTMSAAEQSERIAAMRWHIRKHDVSAWTAAFLGALDKVTAR